MGFSDASDGTGIYLIFCLNPEFLNTRLALSLSSTPTSTPDFP